MDNWYLQKGDQRLGPMTLEALKAMAASGQVASTDLVWTTGMPSWLPASSQPWFFAQPDIIPPPLNQPFSSAQYGTQQRFPAAPPPSLTGWAVAVTFLCCLPGGIVALIYANKAKSQWALGNFAEAESAYKTAKSVLIFSVIAGVVISLIYIVIAIGQK